MSDIYYMYSTNAERNQITTSIFSIYVNTTYKHDDSDVHLIKRPKDIVIIEPVILNRNGEQYSPSFEIMVYSKYGDEDMKIE